MRRLAGTSVLLGPVGHPGRRNLRLREPSAAVKLKPLGDGFIALVKMLIGPVIFCTVVLGIVGAGDMKKVGRVGGKALIYFETVSNISLLIGLVVVNVVRPGAGFNVDPRDAGREGGRCTTRRPPRRSRTTDFLLHLIPKTFIDAFTGSGDLLQVLLDRDPLRLRHVAPRRRRPGRSRLH